MSYWDSVNWEAKAHYVNHPRQKIEIQHPKQWEYDPTAETLTPRFDLNAPCRIAPTDDGHFFFTEPQLKLGQSIPLPPPAPLFR